VARQNPWWPLDFERAAPIIVVWGASDMVPTSHTIQWEMIDEIHWIICFEKNFGSGRIYACSKSEINNFSSAMLFTNNKSLISSMASLSLAIGFPNYNAKINDPENGGLLGCIPIPLQD
jgi:hypothetical protein